MTSGYNRPLYLLAFDQRGSFERDLFDAPRPVPDEIRARIVDAAQVLEWLHVAAAVPGFDGFAVGRTLWEEPLHDLVAGKAERSEAVHTIADRYLETVNGFIV